MYFFCMAAAEPAIEPNPYDTVVEVKRDKEGATTLKHAELENVPGTFGDPFRAVMSLPSVSNMMSLLPAPIVRGAEPGSTGFLLDDVQLPMLFHLLAGPAVVHPQVIDKIDFYPGGFGAEYGGSVGGLINARTLSLFDENYKVELGASLTETSAYVREPVYGTTVTAAGRYGTPQLLLYTFGSKTKMQYWDYQLRLDAGTPSSHWTVFTFGSYDHVEAKDRISVAMQFHRVDLRYERSDQENSDLYHLVVGFDASRLGVAAASIRSLNLSARSRFVRVLNPHWRFGFGTDMTLQKQHSSFTSAEIDDDSPTTLYRGDLYFGGVYSELQFRPTDKWLLRPGVRSDIYYDNVFRAGIDPRFNTRYRLLDQVTLKAATGLYHQPPRYFAPIPALGVASVKEGLLQSWQSSVGTEVTIASVALDVQGFYSAMQKATTSEISDGSLVLVPGRAFGLEILLRKRDRGLFYGWIAYTLSKSERSVAGSYQPFLYDRTHIFQTVAGVHLTQHWDLSAHVQVQTGTPRNVGGRHPLFTRLDVRMDKHAQLGFGTLDFFLEVVNATYARETGGLLGDDGVRLPPLPSLGVRMIF
jgi:hypothetical protein